ncbi:MAG: phosphodiester glycosidase family protein [Muribaculaceae bacterium]|nr:phosphodiester glycosidase family protein [Roseburia sp.]MCM1431094.1 phosphodiester glycosidase family protein [Muribaculaceae bacterium]MCM1492517.1 phosphodiester glycosidase family protein [Muribaculaceae bacterium]
MKKTDKRGKKKRWLIGTGITLCILTVMYLTVAFSHIPFIEKWRTIYIETAMTTNSHQWLATMLFPRSVIDKVMADYEANQKAQENLASTWEEDTQPPAEQPDPGEEAEAAFYQKYWELDNDVVRSYVEAHMQTSGESYDNLLVQDLEEKLGLTTTQGDPLLVLDTANELMIVKVSGDSYQGKLAIVKNPEKVEMVKSKNLGSYGQEAGDFGQQENALLVVNASGFTDVGGHGSGGQVKGSLIIDGVEYGNRDIKGYWKFCGMKKDNKFYIGDYYNISVEDYRWSAEFFPALVVDGESVVDGTFGMGLQPRTAVGQARDGSMLLLIIDGRQVGHSIGCTVEECKNILMRYDVYQAMNLDGGSSAVMWYDGDYITKASSVSGRGRYMPNALIVRKSGS